jgi:hypothetical protein
VGGGWVDWQLVDGFVGGLRPWFACFGVDIAAVGRVDERCCGKHVEDGAGVGDCKWFALMNLLLACVVLQLRF